MKKTLAFVLTFLLLFSIVPATAQTRQFGYTNVETSLRMAASTKAVQQTVLEEGVKVLILSELPDEDESYTWYEITTVKTEEHGYVKSQDVDLVIEKKPIESGKTAVVKGAVVTDESAYPVLAASGVIDPVALLTEEELAKYPLIQAGDNNDASLNVKKRLKELGYFTSDVSNGKITEKMITYIKAFQKQNGLAEDGLITPQLQAYLFSDTALNKKGELLIKDDLQIISASVKNKKGTYISFTFKNNLKKKIDAFNYQMVFYNTYGERYHFMESLADELTMLVSTEERFVIKANERFTLEGLVTDQLFFAGGMLCVTGYHTEDGETVSYQDDQRRWFGFGKGVQSGVLPLIVTPLTEKETAAAEEWKVGVAGWYVDAENAKEYDVREGLLIIEMTPGSPADEAGIQVGDVILAIGDTRIFGGASLARARAAMEPGAAHTMLYYRNGKVYQTTLTRPGGEQSL